MCVCFNRKVFQFVTRSKGISLCLKRRNLVELKASDKDLL